MKKNMENAIRKTLLIVSTIAVASSCFGCTAKTETTTSPVATVTSASTVKSEPAETTVLVTRPEGTSSGEYQDVLYNPTTGEDGLLPTGFPAGAIDPPQIMVNGKLYKYDFDGVKYLPDGYEEIGKILEVNDFQVPEKDFCAAGPSLLLCSGQSVYGSKDNEKRIVVHCENGYYFMNCN